VGKTKTTFITGAEDQGPTGAEKYKERQLKKAQQEADKDKVHLPGLKGGQRVVAITADPLPDETEESGKEQKKKAKKRSKKYIEVKSKVDRDKLYKTEEAVKLAKETSYSKFDGSVELHMVIKRDSLSVNVNLPFSSGKAKKIEIADEATIKKLEAGKADFDVLLATADMMPKLVPFAKLLGPKGLMPNPKNGTLIKNAKDAEKFSGNTLTVKTEKKAPLIHTVVGKVSMPDEELSKNTDTVMDAVNRRVIEKAYLKSTMGPSIKLAI
jgi:large subunit ribosomal protein L1